MDSYLISVVVPVYNAEKYLDRCVSSIANQTYKNLEIILVDDGSADNSFEICKLWEKKDKRVKVIHSNVNIGTMAARKAGIAVAHGDYIGFVDSDDWIDKDMYGYLLKILLQNSAQISAIQLREMHADAVAVEGQNSPSESLKIYDFNSIVKSVKWGSMCKSLYEKTLFNDLPPLPENIICMEDMLLNYFVYKKMNRMVVSNQIKYNYFRHPSSVGSGCISYRLIDDGFKSYEMVNDDFDKLSAVYPYFVASKIMTDFFFLNSIVRNQMCLDRYAMLREDILKYKQYIFNKKYKDAFEPRHRIGTFLLAVAPKVYNSTILIRRKIRGY